MIMLSANRELSEAVYLPFPLSLSLSCVPNERKL